MHAQLCILCFTHAVAILLVHVRYALVTIQSPYVRIKHEAKSTKAVCASLIIYLTNDSGDSKIFLNEGDSNLSPQIITIRNMYLHIEM